MTEPLIDPVNNVPVEWHRFLYRSVLLEWEIAVHQRKDFSRFNGRKPLAHINLVKVDSLPELLQLVNNQAPTTKPSECLVFYSKGTALKDLFRLVRNCVAHGHYSVPRHGWIQLHHNHQGKLTLTGQVKFSNLKSLVAAIAGGNPHLEIGNA